MYEENEYLPLSGIQHYAFCERQWGLIHIEQQWVENVLTAEGRLLHHRVDDPYFIETRGDVKTVRSVPLCSRTLGIYGIADVIELYKDDEVDNYSHYSIVEYKRGRPKTDDRDEVQLCAQAICLEEMLEIKLNYGYMYYDQIQHRKKVIFNENLRERVKFIAEQMHSLYDRGETPLPEKGKRCQNCSMKDICLPKLSKKNKVKGYMNELYKEMQKND